MDQKQGSDLNDNGRSVGIADGLIDITGRYTAKNLAKGKPPYGKLALAAVAVVSVLATYLWVPLLPACDSPEQAYDGSKDFVLRRLKSPSTASMPWNLPNDATVQGTSCKYTVTAYADAENGFGAQGRVWYVAHMEYRRDRGRWELNNLTVDPPEEILRVWRGW